MAVVAALCEPTPDLHQRPGPRRHARARMWVLPKRLLSCADAQDGESNGYGEDAAMAAHKTPSRPPLPRKHGSPARGCLRNNARAWTWCFQCAALPTSLDGGPCSTTASGSLELGSSQTCAARKILAALGHRRPQRKTSPSINAPAASCSAKAAHASGAAPTWSCQLPSAYLAPRGGGVSGVSGGSAPAGPSSKAGHPGEQRKGPSVCVCVEGEPAARKFAQTLERKALGRRWLVCLCVSG